MGFFVRFTLFLLSDIAPPSLLLQRKTISEIFRISADSFVFVDIAEVPLECWSQYVATDVDNGSFLVNDNLEPGAERQCQVFVVPNAAVHHNRRVIMLFIIMEKICLNTFKRKHANQVYLFNVPFQSGSARQLVRIISQLATEELFV